MPLRRTWLPVIGVRAIVLAAVIAAVLSLGLPAIRSSDRHRVALALPPLTRPDIILVTIDALRADHVSRYGYPAAHVAANRRLLAPRRRLHQCDRPGALHKSLGGVADDRAVSQHSQNRDRVRAFSGDDDGPTHHRADHDGRTLPERSDARQASTAVGTGQWASPRTRS